MNTATVTASTTWQDNVAKLSHSVCEHAGGVVPEEGGQIDHGKQA